MMLCLSDTFSSHVFPPILEFIKSLSILLNKNFVLNSDSLTKNNACIVFGWTNDLYSNIHDKNSNFILYLNWINKQNKRTSSKI